MAYDFKNILRCGAKSRTRGGAPCRGPAMANGRCRMHAGNAKIKHGRCTKQAAFERGKERKFLKEMQGMFNEMESICG